MLNVSSQKQRREIRRLSAETYSNKLGCLPDQTGRLPIECDAEISKFALAAKQGPASAPLPSSGRGLDMFRAEGMRRVAVTMQHWRFR
jgi:hypothetical protein